MDATKIPYCIILVLLCCQYGVSYRVYILPEPGAFCLGVFSGDDCITWSEYSANPTFFVGDSTTLIFTPGNYTLSGRYHSSFSVANINTFIMIGDTALLQFPLSLSNIERVEIHNLTFEWNGNTRFDVRSVHYFLMESCILYILESGGSLSFYAPSRSSLNKITNSTLEKVLLDIHQYWSIHMIMLITASIFTNYSGTAIIGNSYSNTAIQSSRFTNSYVQSGYLIRVQNSLTVTACRFDRNNGRYAIIYSRGDVVVANSSFEANGGHAIWRSRNINISNCTFSETSSVVYYPLNYYNPHGQVYVTDSRFYWCSRPIYSHINVTVINSYFSNSVAGGGGAVIYTEGSVTLIDCTIVNNTASSGDGGAVYSQGKI